MLLHKCVNKQPYNQLLDKHVSAAFTHEWKTGSVSQWGGQHYSVSALLLPLKSMLMLGSVQTLLFKATDRSEKINLATVQLLS